ncbi:DUF167 domain-containing protein [Humidesulfovibrio sp.]|uniref:DUF167 domain-containing protein n=1 Tax=Humidesulfovibrio sp. TaxID=2910988 RepID=UPI003526743A
MQVWVQPGAKRNELAGLHQNCLKIRLSAPAVDNKANTALVEYVAALLGLKRSQVSLEAGHTSRRKTLRVLAQKEPIWPQVQEADQAGGQPPTEGATHGSNGSRPHRKV